MNRQELYLKTMFCCMACDGDIADEEVALVRKTVEGNELFAGLDVEKLINLYVEEINRLGSTFLRRYIHELKAETLTEEEQLRIVDLAVEMIEADNVIEYAEVKFFKKIRRGLTLTDEQILAHHPDKEDWLLPDLIVSEEIEWGDVQFEPIDFKKELN